MAGAFLFSSSASSSRVNTLCAAVMDGTRDVGKDVRHGRCATTPRRQLTYSDTTAVLVERVTFCVKADGLRKVGQHAKEHVPGSTTNRWTHEVLATLLVRAIQKNKFWLWSVCDLNPSLPPKKCQSEAHPPPPLPPQMSMTLDLPQCQEERRGGCPKNVRLTFFFFWGGRGVPNTALLIFVSAGPTPQTDIFGEGGVQIKTLLITQVLFQGSAK